MPQVDAHPLGAPRVCSGPSMLPGEPHNTNLLFTSNPWVLAPLPAGKKHPAL